MNLQEARRLGFQFRRSHKGDRIGIKSTITVKDKAGTHKAERLNYEDLYNPILVIHKPQRHSPSEFPIRIFRNTSNNKGIVENWHNNRIYQAALREARDRAAGYHHKLHCWFPTRDMTEDAERMYLMDIYNDIHDSNF